MSKVVKYGLLLFFIGVVVDVLLVINKINSGNNSSGLVSTSRPFVVSPTPVVTSRGNSTRTADLSYIVLDIERVFELKVFGSSGDEIIDKTYINEPLVDDISGVLSNSLYLRTFMLPKPPLGEYIVKIRGVGKYNLESFLYTVDGNRTVNKFGNTLLEGQVDEYKVVIMGSQNYIQKM